MHVSVDDGLCVGHSLCIGIAPEVFTMDEDDDVAKVIDPDPRTELHSAVHEAERACPARAILVRP